MARKVLAPWTWHCAVGQFVWGCSSSWHDWPTKWPHVLGLAQINCKMFSFERFHLNSCPPYQPATNDRVSCPGKPSLEVLVLEYLSALYRFAGQPKKKRNKKSRGRFSFSRRGKCDVVCVHGAVAGLRWLQALWLLRNSWQSRYGWAGLVGFPGAQMVSLCIKGSHMKHSQEQRSKTHWINPIFLEILGSGPHRLHVGTSWSVFVLSCARIRRDVVGYGTLMSALTRLALG